METGCDSLKSFALDYIKDLKHRLSTLDIECVDRIIDILWEAYLNNKQIFVMGNGGSASTASHFACDLSKGTIVDGKKRLRVLSLNDNMALITALSNDLNYDAVFKEQLINLVNPKDVVIAITASGNSPNILKAVEYARQKGALTIGFIGFDGGKLKPMLDEYIVVSSRNYGHIEDIHLILEHMISQCLKQRLISEN
ncbi:MAG: phosphoheptose isomerase [Candidatus Scalindua rubra]|uniref:Phosphoheptose isomerase n=1 Tax=Candidatus Scalindua rubra TaxID=1872076 RepID=A0A1E3XG57_9BACT|nr:MAG: phosphoheptose isomerase [Candidatus Scalindua rubra]